jgi:S1-C subfamily serine protease
MNESTFSNDWSDPRSVEPRQPESSTATSDTAPFAPPPSPTPPQLDAPGAMPAGPIPADPAEAPYAAPIPYAAPDSPWAPPAVPYAPPPALRMTPPPASPTPPPAHAPFTAFGPLEAAPASAWTPFDRQTATAPVSSARSARNRRSLGSFLAIGLLSATLASGGTVVALKSAGLLDAPAPVASTQSGGPSAQAPIAAAPVAAQPPAAPNTGGSSNGSAPGTTTPAAAAPSSGSSVVDAVARVSPAVVTIIQSTSAANSNQSNPFGGGNGNGNGSNPGSSGSPSAVNPYNLPNGQSPTGVGSGVIFDSNGWILTNHHVVAGADTLTVRLNDGRTFPAKVYGIDTLTDLAIVKIEATGLPTATLGTSSSLRPGQSVIAIGNPLGEYTNSVTTGVVSGLNRSIDLSEGALDDLIQTDAAINPGNSGGPLLDTDGNVVGINTAEASSAQGIGFAIPVDLAKPLTKQALAGDKLSRPWLGIRYLALDAGVAAANKLSVDHGAWITTSGGSGSTAPAIEAGSPAEKAGLKANDIITAVDGTSVDGAHPLVELLAGHNPDSTITLTVQRGSDSIQVSVTLATRPATTQ